MERDMQLLIPSCITLPLPKKELQDLISKAKDWTLLHGLSSRPETNLTNDILQHNRFTLLPSVFPKAEFENACEIQKVLNILMHRVAHDYDFLKESLAETIKVDEFTRKLFEIYEKVHNEGFTQKISLAVMRSDIMLDTNCQNMEEMEKPYFCWKQVEINTIAVGMAGTGPASTELHKFVLGELGLHNLKKKHLPENKALEGVCSGLLDAWKIYNKPQAQILFVVEEFATNIADQRLIEFQIKIQNPMVKVLRRTLTQLINLVKLGVNKELIVDDKIIAVVYFRSGYKPGQYPTEKEWDVRLMIERSLAIKSPSIQYHLAGTKKIQQKLADSKILSRYLEDEELVAAVKKIFTGLYSLDMNEEGNAAAEMGQANPGNFVLKPQREGGGNNLYGNDIKIFLESTKKSNERSAWILMDKIIPPPQLNYLICPGNMDNNVQCNEVEAEIGIFGIIMGDKENIIINKQVGHSGRTKPTTANEAGLSFGSGANDSPFLIDF